MSKIYANSPVGKMTFRGRDYYVKRDDLIDKYFNGNKARKFYYYLQQDLSKYKKVASYGGNQANAMLSLAAFAKIKNLQFDYYIKPLSKTLQTYPIGNFKQALELGMNYIELDDYDDFYQKMSKPDKSYNALGEDTILIRQGGAEKEAEQGVKMLADEIKQFTKENNIKKLSIFIQSGTGTTALFLQKNIDFKVYTTPTIGDKKHLLKQFALLDDNPQNYPEILYFNKKYHHGKLYKEFYDIWKEINTETGIEFELLYDPPTLIALDKFQKNINHDIMYIHSGGIIGNESMIKRYERKYRK